MRISIVVVFLFSMVGCEIPTIWETTTYRTVHCSSATVWENEVDGHPITLTIDDQGTRTYMADSVRYEKCNDDWYEGRVIIWDNGWKPR